MKRRPVPSTCALVIAGALGACSPPAEPGRPDCDVSDAAALEVLATAGDLQCNLDIAETAFTELSALEGVRSVPYSVVLRENGALADAGGLRTLEQWSFAQITRNPLLREVVLGGGEGFEDFLVAEDGVERLELPTTTSGRNLLISGAPRLVSLEAPLLVSVDRLTISGTGLAGFPGLAALSSVTTAITIRDNPRLSSAEIAAFVAGLVTAPTDITTCSNQDDDACP